ncbi:glycosylinositol phosphorylceramide mannosyl transferase 1 isoform X2 [Cryptomeria japonica]|uniref:glycosylinositol phosphorylceramide mannosyl transferase 1 isoform X2 n=1 Tax=Cryptomeria japonica TaxID=3369 RepID=UPI0027DAAE2B|nr:glycosylinositol phosphorylceramide mannosyl transferase 1 isoform X2 [Cryptomeria japonica]
MGLNTSDSVYSPSREKGVMRGGSRHSVIKRVRVALINIGSFKLKILLVLCIVFALLLIAAPTGSLMGWRYHHSLHSKSPNYRLRYTVLINTWRRNSLLKQAVAHYASCSSIDAIHVVWSEDDLPSATLQSHLRKAVYSKSSSNYKPEFRFDLNEDDNLNNRFKPIEGLRNDAIFSVDDDVLIPCRTLEFAFSVWQSAPESMVGFVPRMHWVDAKKSGAMHYNYGGWWSVWWMGTYSMVLSKAAFFHKKYLDMYTYQMPASVQEYVSRERNCEDIAMSFLVANATGAPPIWVKGKVFEIGSSGISSLKGHSQRRNKCLNDFVTLYGYMPLVPSNVKAVNAQYEWFW